MTRWAESSWALGGNAVGLDRISAQGSGCGPLLGRMPGLDKLAGFGLQPKPADRPWGRGRWQGRV